MVEKFENYMDEELMAEEMEDAMEEAEEVLGDASKRQTVIEKAFELCERLSGLPVVGTYIGDIPKLCAMVSDYASGAYREVPLSTIITVLGVIVYFVSPVDAIPDTIPILGYVDDMSLLRMILNTMHDDIIRYYTWLLRTQEV